MDGTFVESLSKALVRPTLIRVNGQDRVFVPVSSGGFTEAAGINLPEVEPKPLTFGTLQGLVDYIEANRDKLNRPDLVIHATPRIVCLLGTLREPFAQRFCYAKSDVNQVDTGNDYNGFMSKYHEVEDFVIGLQALFVQTDDVKTILAVVGNIKGEAVRQVSDDGVTQSVVARMGAVLSTASVPNPVLLAPYRTFREIEQPTSRYVLRVRCGEDGELPQVGLFSGDGESWSLLAASRIKNWLQARVTNIPVLA